MEGCGHYRVTPYICDGRLFEHWHDCKSGLLVRCTEVRVYDNAVPPRLVPASRLAAYLERVWARWRR